MDLTFQNRTNILIEPATPDGSIIFYFHGWGGTPANDQGRINLEAQYPNSYIVYMATDPSLVNRAWQSNISDVDSSYWYSLLSQLKSLYSITSVHLIGHSNGGQMVYKIASILEEHIDSISCIACTYDNPHEFDFKGNVLHIHGGQDDIFPINTHLTELEDDITNEFQNAQILTVSNATHNLDDIILKTRNFYTLVWLNMGIS